MLTILLTFMHIFFLIPEQNQISKYVIIAASSNFIFSYEFHELIKQKYKIVSSIS